MRSWTFIAEKWKVILMRKLTLIAVLFMIDGTGKYPMSINGWIIKQIMYIHIMEYYSATKRHGLLTYASGIDLKGFIWVKKPNPKSYTLFDSIYTTALKLQSYRGKIAGYHELGSELEDWRWMMRDTVMATKGQHKKLL